MKQLTRDIMRTQLAYYQLFNSRTNGIMDSLLSQCGFKKAHVITALFIIRHNGRMHRTPLLLFVMMLWISSLNERVEKEVIGHIKQNLPWDCELIRIEKDQWTFPKEYIDARRLIHRPI